MTVDPKSTLAVWSIHKITTVSAAPCFVWEDHVTQKGLFSCERSLTVAIAARPCNGRQRAVIKCLRSVWVFPASFSEATVRRRISPQSKTLVQE